MKSKILGLLAVMLLALPMSGHAASTTWDVSGTFDDGGTFFGSFRLGYDGCPGGIADVDVTTTAGSYYQSSHTYTDRFNWVCESTPEIGYVWVGLGDAYLPYDYLRLWFAAPLTSTGGSVLLSSMPNVSFEFRSDELSVRYVNAGTATARSGVPLPAAAWLLLSGLGGLGLMRHRKTH